MKKLLVMLLVVVLAFGLVACGEKEAENVSEEPETKTDLTRTMVHIR